MKINTLKV